MGHVGGGEGETGPGGMFCSLGSGTPSKSRARGLIGDVSRIDSLGFLAVLCGVQVWCWRRPCGVPFTGYRGLLPLPWLAKKLAYSLPMTFTWEGTLTRLIS